jgi:hypothetical protein
MIYQDNRFGLGLYEGQGESDKGKPKRHHGFAHARLMNAPRPPGDAVVLAGGAFSRLPHARLRFTRQAPVLLAPGPE